MKRYSYTYGGVTPFTPDPRGPWVLLSDAEAAIAAARAEWEANGPYFTSVVHGCCEEKETAYQQGQRDMLAKCIAAVTLDVVNRGLDAYDDEFFSRTCPHPDGTDSICYECNKERVVTEIHSALQALQEKP